MPQLLLELFSEEIPARMQAKAEADLEKALTAKLSEAGLSFGEVRAWSGPRRLGVCVEGLAVRSADVREERKGPKVGAPEQALAGFLRGAGLSDISQAEIRSDPKKGDFYVAVIDTPGRDATDIIAEAVPDIIRGFHWPKSMRSDTRETRWVRPLQRIVCVFDGQTVDFEVDGLKSGNETEGHRVHGRGPFTVTGWEDYQSQLEGAGHVLLTRAARRDLIADAAAKLCKAKKLELVEDKGLLEEVTGLAEWPVVILGDMDPDFLELPDEVIQLSMRVHQKYFAVRDPKTGELAPHFIVVANLEATDGGNAIAAGNAQVLSARLSDAKFFYENDLKTGLEAMLPGLASRTFKEELGSMADKVERVAALARELAPKVGADPDLAETAAKLAKADLVSAMVGEFPELQGVMGRYYALEAGEEAAAADAIRDHYKPQGPSDAVPTDPVSIAVALADKLDTLVGFWAIDEKPTGSKDPFALRRAALGVVRIVLENGLRLSPEGRLGKLHGFQKLFEGHRGRFGIRDAGSFLETKRGVDVVPPKISTEIWDDIADLLAFFADRLKVHLKEEGIRHDLIDAVFALGEDDLVLITKRAEALQAFLATDDGTALLAGYKRAANILKAEEKKGWSDDGSGVDESLLEAGEERALHDALAAAMAKADTALQQERFEDAMAALSGLRGPVDAFFDGVTVNADDERLRNNRLKLLGDIRGALHRVADFSKIEG